jgi:hypothetical protein
MEPISMDYYEVHRVLWSVTSLFQPNDIAQAPSTEPSWTLVHIYTDKHGTWCVFTRPRKLGTAP